MIPTQYKSKLGKSLSWPIGAEAISAAMIGFPHFEELYLSFHTLRDLNESGPNLILAAEYRPARKPGYGGMTSMIESGWFDERWSITVYPTHRKFRAVAGPLLREFGLLAVVEWLKSSEISGWKNRQHRLELMFNSSDGTLVHQIENGA